MIFRDEEFAPIDAAGFQLETFHGGFAGRPVDDDSHEYVFVARRP